MLETSPAPSSPGLSSPTESDDFTAHAASPTPDLDKNTRGVTPRVVILSLLLAAFFAYFIPTADYRFSNTFLGATHFPPGALAALLLMLLVVNPLLKLASHRLMFSRNETLTVYLTCLFSTLVPGIGGNNYFVSFIIGSFYYSTRENKWFDALKGLPPWFTPALNADGSYNKYVVESWYTGLAQGEHIPWGAWVVPLLAWSVFLFASFAMTACLSVMLRAQWGRNEALAFPLLRLPLELTEDMDGPQSKTPFLRNPLLWLGFGITAFVQMVNGLHLYYPDVPAIPLSLLTGPLFTEAPWNQIGYITVRVFPVAVGIAFLMTSEMSLSCWLFFWICKFELILAYFAGYPAATLPKVKGMDLDVMSGFQEVGAYLGYFVLVLWMARRHLGHIALRGLGRAQAEEDEKQEALPYPVAFWGFCLSFSVMFLWGLCAGMSPLLCLALWMSYLVIAVVLSRIVAEGGLIFVSHTWMPLGALAGLVGMGQGTLLSTSHGIVPAAAMEYTVVQDFRASLMPSFVQSFKLAYDRRIAGRPLFLLIFAVIIVGMLIGFTMNVRLGYNNGGLSLQNWLSKWGPMGLGEQVSSLSTGSQSVSLAAWFWTIVGALTIGAMTLARSRWAWFPLHPVGFIMSQSYAMSMIWFSIFLGWACKSAITRFGGNEAYRKTTPLFLGLALGDVSMMLFWLAIDNWQGTIGHQLMPG